MEKDIPRGDQVSIETRPMTSFSVFSGGGVERRFVDLQNTGDEYMTFVCDVFLLLSVMLEDRVALELEFS